MNRPNTTGLSYPDYQAVPGETKPLAQRESQHILVVGGTGMLRGLCIQLASSGWQLSVIARNQRRLDRLASDAERFRGIIRGFSLDYRDSPALKAAIRSAETFAGPIDTSVCWIHSNAPEALHIVVDAVRRRLIHVHGSARNDPARSLIGGPPIGTTRLHYQAVVLGYHMTPFGSRWLTDDEIVRGVIQAFETGENLVVVGRTAPWSLRPG